MPGARWAAGAGTGVCWAFDEQPLRHPENWLIEVDLVADCLEEEGEEILPIADPCGWRHAWYYRVEPDDTVTLLFEEGDPDELANG